jgi:hypothetical protein
LANTLPANHRFRMCSMLNRRHRLPLLIPRAVYLLRARSVWLCVSEMEQISSSMPCAVAFLLDEYGYSVWIRPIFGRLPKLGLDGYSERDIWGKRVHGEY